VRQLRVRLITGLAVARPVKETAAAVRAMINEMEQIPFSCNVVVGDGVDENVRTLNPGSTFGTGDVAGNMERQLLTTYHSLAKAA